MSDRYTCSMKKLMVTAQIGLVQGAWVNKYSGPYSKECSLLLVNFIEMTNDENVSYNPAFIRAQTVQT